MRLRLSVQRHKLPATNILWNVPRNASSTAYTIARLLEDINAILPLEAEHWGLEDYIVELDGYECLHFSPVAQALKDDDTVSIRPLLTAEVRARTLCGRYQIDEGGKHLVDGVPFGRPLLRTPHRPSVTIPPRKRQRMMENAPAGDQTVPAGLITANGETSPAQNGFDLAEANVNGEDTAGTRTQGQKRKRVSFGHVSVAEEDSEEEEDEDFAPQEVDDGDSADSTDGSSEDESDDSGDSDTSSSDADTDSDSESGSNTNSSSDSDSDSDTQSDSSASSGPEILPSNPNNPPGKGDKDTKRRNKRRSESKRLHKMKASGELPPDATLSDMRDRDNAHSTGTDEQEEGIAEGFIGPLPPDADSKKRKRGNETPIDGQTETGDEAQDREELERRKQRLLAQMTPEPSTAKQSSATPESARKRLRPDVSAIGRILSRQARQLDKKTPKAKPTPPKEPSPPPDPDFWKSKINLSAFECWEEDYELSAPPFPFKQHWDPASKEMHDKANKKRQKNRGKKVSESSAVDEIEESLILDYGDEPTGADVADKEDSVAIEEQLMQDVATAAKPDLPELPEDINSLPALTPSDIKPGAVITFKVFELNPVNMNPEISPHKTAIVEKEGDSGNGAGDITLKLAERDRFRKEKKFDKNGNLIMDTADKFQMEDSEEEDDGLLYHRFADFMEPKLLKAA